MPFNKVKILSLILIITFTAAIAGASAEQTPETGGSKGPTPGEETKSGGGGADREWAKRTSRLNVLETKVTDLEKLLKNLIEQKKHTRTYKDEKGNEIDILQKIADEHKKMKGVVADYNKEKAELKYRYPEEGALIERRYMPLRERSLEQIEREIGLAGELTRTKAKIDKKYAPFTKDEAPPPPKTTTLAEPTVKEAPKAGAATEEGLPPKLKLSQ